jgi:hypothetical protein
MKINKRYTIASILGAAAIAGALALVAGPVKDFVTAKDSSSLSDDGAFRFHFPAGDVYTYQFDFESLQLLAAPRKGGQPIGGSLSLAGELRLRSYAEHEGKYRLGVSLPILDRHELRFQGNDLLTDDEAKRTFGEREAFVEVTNRGEIATLWFEKEAPPTFRSVMESVIPIIAVHAPETNQLMWSSEEATPLGTAQTFYVADESSPLVARRNRSSYLGLKAFAMGPAPGDLDLQSEGTVKLAEAGHVDALDLDETLSVQDDGKDPRFSATLKAKLLKKHVTRFLPQAIAFTPGRFESVRPGEVLTSEQVQRKMWEEMVGSMTLSDVELGIGTYALRGVSPEDGWLTKAVLLLKMNPAYATRLSDLFQQPGMTAEGRAFICDLLASAGTPSAQTALRDALGSDAAQADPQKYPGLLQRFSFVKEPTPETMAFLEAEMTRGMGDGRLAAAYSLGATAGHLRSGGKDYAVYNGKLVEGLKNAASPEEKRAMVGALGNVGAPENIPVLTNMSRDESPEVRRAVARALRKNDTPEARNALFDLVSDENLEVGQTAISTLADQTLGNGDVERLERAVTSDGFNPSLDQHVVTLLSKLPQDGEARVRMLDAILSRTTDARGAARVRMLRGG